MVVLRLSGVLEKTGSGRSRIYKEIAAGLAPPPFHWGSSSCWFDHEWELILAARAAGACDDDIRALVQQILDARKEKWGALRVLQK